MSLLSRGVDLPVGATRWLGTAGIAVLLAPVLPDLAVDIFGDPTDPSRDWWLRLLALALLLALVLGLTAANLRWTAHRTRRRGRDQFADLRPAEILAVSLSLGRDNALPYTHIDRREGRGPQIAEFLVAGTAPTTVVGVMMSNMPSSPVIVSGRSTGRVDATKQSLMPADTAICLASTSTVSPAAVKNPTSVRSTITCGTVSRRCGSKWSFSSGLVSMSTSPRTVSTVASGGAGCVVIVRSCVAECSPGRAVAASGGSFDDPDGKPAVTVSAPGSSPRSGRRRVVWWWR